MQPVLSKLKLKRLILCKLQKDVADAIGISQTYLAQMENGKETLRGEMLIKLATYYNCRVSDLI